MLFNSSHLVNQEPEGLITQRPVVRAGRTGEDVYTEPPERRILLDLGGGVRKGGTIKNTLFLEPKYGTQKAKNETIQTNESPN